MVIGNLIVGIFTRHQIVWSTIKNYSRYKTINLGIGGYRAKNDLWGVSDLVLPKSVTSAVTHCSTTNIDTSNSDEISLGFAVIARSICHRHPDIEVSGLLQREIIWSTWSKNNEDQCLSEKLLRQIQQNNFHEPRHRLDFPRLLFKQLFKYYKRSPSPNRKQKHQIL